VGAFLTRNGSQSELCVNFWNRPDKLFSLCSILCLDLGLKREQVTGGSGTGKRSPSYSSISFLHFRNTGVHQLLGNRSSIFVLLHLLPVLRCVCPTEVDEWTWGSLPGIIPFISVMLDMFMFANIQFFGLVGGVVAITCGLRASASWTQY
jgi:hypothetical protein